MKIIFQPEFGCMKMNLLFITDDKALFLDEDPNALFLKLDRLGDSPAGIQCNLLKEDLIKIKKLIDEYLEESK